MGTPLTGSTVASTYTGLLKTSDNATITSTLKSLGDGGGNDSALQVSTTAVNTTGDFSVATSKFTVAASSGNASVAGALGVTGVATVGSLATAGNIATSAGTISSFGAISQTQAAQNNSLAGNLAVGGNLNVTGATTLSGNLSVPGTLSCTGDFAVNTNKFNVTASSGNTAVAGTLGVAGATNLSSTLSVTGDTTLGNVTVTSDASVFGSLSITGAITTGAINALGQIVTQNNLTVNGNTIIGNASTDVLTINANNITLPNATTVTVDLDNDKVLITDASDSSKVRTVAASALGITASNAPQLVQTAYRGVKTVTAANTGFGTELTDITSSITPRSAGSKVLIQIMLNYGADSLTSQFGVFKLVRNSTEIGGNTTTPGTNGVTGIAQVIYPDASSGNSMNNVFIQFVDSPSTTSSVTYKLFLYSAGFGGKYSVIHINYSQNDSTGGSLDNSRASSVMTLQEFFA